MVGELAEKLYPDGIDIPAEDFFSSLSNVGKGRKSDVDNLHLANYNDCVRT